MARLLERLLPLFLLGLCFSPLLRVTGPSAAYAEDVAEGEEDEEDGMVSDEEEEEEEEEETVTIPVSQTGDAVAQGTAKDEEEEEEEEDVLGPSPDVETVVIFTNREEESFVAGEIVHSLLGFSNKGEHDFIVTGIEASFRYPQDFSYFIQNFSMSYYETLVPSNSEASFVYSFKPSESFYSRPFGLVVNIYYKDAEGNEFRDAVFNTTVNIVEIDEGFDVETFFMYVFMVSGLCLFMFVVHYVWTTFNRGGRSSSKKAPVEMGTQNKRTNIDYSWLPEGTIPKKSPRNLSPRNRNSPRNRQRKQNSSSSTANVD